MRKVFAVLFVALLLGSFLVVPTFAAGKGDSPGYAMINFDYLYTGSYSSGSFEYDTWYSWQGGYVAQDTVLSGEGGNYSYELHAYSDSMDMYVYTYPQFALTCSDQYVRAEWLHSFLVTFGVDAELVGTVDYSLEVLVFEEVNDVWLQSAIPVSSTFIVSGYNAALGSDILREIERVYTGDIIRIRNLVLEFNVETDGGLDYHPEIGFEIGVTEYPPQYLGAEWVQGFNLECEETVIVEGVPGGVSDVSFTDWLGNSMEGIMGAKLFGTFSLGGILTAVLSIGVVVALIKFFSR